VSAARDLDLLRATLGDSSLNYLGYSYGTFLGSTYADLYPQKVGRLVLDGALDPRSGNFDVSVGQAVGFENALKAYLTDCLAGSSCPFDGSVDDGMAKIGQLLSQVDASPIRATDGRELGSSSLLTAIIYPLYDATAWDYLSDMFSDVMAGNADYAMQFADGYNGRQPDGSYKDNSTEAFMAINCLDYAYTNDPAVVQKQNADLAAAAPTIGPWWSYGDISCEVWPHKTTRTPHAVTAEGAAPILVVGTTGDPATPYAWAEALAEQLSSGQLITFVGEGHTAYGRSDCVKGVVDDYFLNGTVPASDPRCTS
jgi:pimeloyl-ACP methyl ester carboxylesterase